MDIAPCSLWTDVSEELSAASSRSKISRTRKQRVARRFIQGLHGAISQKTANLITTLIWGVCILLRVWYRMMRVLIRLRNVTIVG
jgi:hypothetical protein